MLMYFIGVVKVVAVDGTENSQLATKYEVKGFPTLKIFGSDKKKPVEYSGTIHTVFVSVCL